MENRYYFLTPVDLQVLQRCPDGDEVILSLDLGMSQQPVRRRGPQMILADGTSLPLPSPRLSANDAARTILIFREGQWTKWQYYDEKTGRFYKPVFVAEGQPPTVEISGIKMHVTDAGGPQRDTRKKLQALGLVRGRVLDTCCGLGYTAIALAGMATVQQVITIEKDETMVRICRENPWSQALFHSAKIQLIRGDVTEVIQGLRSGRFNAVLHDPPRYALAPELYTTSFYRELWRVLRRGGRLYHYTGNPRKQQSRGLPERTAARLQEAGFIRVRHCYQGVCARKP
ncbi:MAG: methyltransferase domain-containing protein [Calditrichaeota bacterium]|nr:methyltransferase domain-containing protein [Calditrichota bacterium]